MKKVSSVSRITEFLLEEVCVCVCVHVNNLSPSVCVQCCPSGSVSAGSSPPQAPARPPEHSGPAGGLLGGRCWPTGSPTFGGQTQIHTHRNIYIVNK